MNAAATTMLIKLQYDVRKYELAPARSRLAFRHARADSIGNLVVFLICIPAGYVIGSHRAPYVLLLLLITGNVTRWRYRRDTA